MFCPQCGTESPADLKFCRTCGANLRVIGKAVTLSEAIARSDSVPSKIKDLVANLKIEKVSDEVARAMEKVKQEIAHTAEDHRDWHLNHSKPLGFKRKEKTAEQRREKHLVSGSISFFTGIGLSIVLYFVSHALLGKFPPADFEGRPFDFDSLLRIAWVIGLLPTFAGFGHIIAGLTIRRHRPDEIVAPETPLRIGEPAEPSFAPAPAFASQHDDEAEVFGPLSAPHSVTDRTTNILERKLRVGRTNELENER
ncbi:MAG: zinc ribbon domain-containing protein [Pyrinomonadaceae bacterium]